MQITDKIIAKRQEELMQQGATLVQAEDIVKEWTEVAVLAPSGEDRHGQTFKSFKSFAAEQLGKDPAFALAVLPTLVKRLSDAEHSSMVAGVIETLGPKAESAVPALVAAFLRERPDDLGGSDSTREATLRSLSTARATSSTPGLASTARARRTRWQ